MCMTSTFSVDIGFGPQGEVEPVNVSTKYLAEQNEVIGNVMNLVYAEHGSAISPDEFENLDAVRNLLGEIRQRLEDDGIVVLEMSE